MGPETGTAFEFKHAQDSDNGLDSYRTTALAGSNEYHIIEGLLYKRARLGDTMNNGGYVLVLPAVYEREAIRLAHSSLWGGHLGSRKTVQRISNDFFFPRLKQKVAQYIKCCHICQKTRGIQTKNRQPMSEMEIITGHAFSDITVDLLGSKLPMTAKKTSTS